MAPVHKLSAMGSLTSNKIDYPSMLAGNAVFSPTSYDSIATVTVGTATNTITFSSIPQTYTHLQLRCLVFGDAIGNTSNQRFNADSGGTNYYCHRLFGNGSTAGAGAFANQMYFPNTGSATMPGVAVIDYLDYTNTNKNKTVRALEGADDNSTGGFLTFWSGLWSSTAAINTITISLPTTNYRSGSVFALYGIKGA